jgi:hypothetical protein
MVFPLVHPNPYLAGVAKGMWIVLQEQCSVYDRLVQEVGGESKVFGKCSECQKSAAKKDAECQVALAEMAGQEDEISKADLEQATQTPAKQQNKWCCLL